MKTWVFPFSRRNGFEWTIRSRSRWNGVRTPHGSSGRRRPLVSYERTASGDSHASSRSRTRSSKSRDARSIVSIASRVIRAAACAACARDLLRRQNERDWPPSTVTQVPTTHDARPETRNATTSAISSTVPKRPHGSSRSTNAADPVGILSLAPLPAPAREQRRARRDAEHADPVLREVRGHRLREADLRRLGDVVAGAASALASPDRRDQGDDASAARAEGGKRGAGHVERREEVLVEDATGGRPRPCRRSSARPSRRRC